MLRLITCLLSLMIFHSGLSFADPLPSWNDTPVKQAITDYLITITSPDSPDFVPEAERVAVFDNDGTFICERPEYPSTLFQAGLVKSFIADGTIDGSKMPFKAWKTLDRKALKKYGIKDSYKEMNSAFGGMGIRPSRVTLKPE